MDTASAANRTARRVQMHALRRHAAQTRHSRRIRPGRKITPQAPGRRHTELGPKRFTKLRPSGSNNGRITLSPGSSDAALWYKREATLLKTGSRWRMG